MEIEINLAKLSSYSDLFEELEEIENQLQQHLLYGNNSCFLISGYRGTGKTTLISSLEKKINNCNILFVHLNISKYEDYSIILRKLIRNTYLSFLAHSKYKFLKKKNKNLINNIELLYDHTFYEVFKSSNVKNLKQYSNSLEINFCIKDIIKQLSSNILIILSTLNINFDIISIISKKFNYIMLFLGIFLNIFNLFKMNPKFSKDKTSIEELFRKSLYDDEIAEYQLINILKELNNEDFKIIFVFDELDKIENENEMQKIISAFKPLLLSNLANFIIVSGQKLYYNLIKSNTLDDSIMSSIFSKTIHVPLTEIKTLEILFNDLINTDEIKNTDLIEKYKDSLILNSYKTIRKFINLISQNIIWKNEKAYLYIEDENINEYDNDSLILSILTDIIENFIDILELENGLKDFFIYQLFIWINKMKLKGTSSFSKIDIFNFKEDYSEIYPSWTEFLLENLYNELIKNLLFKNLIHETNNSYKWSNKISMTTNIFSDELTYITSLFLKDIIITEKICKDINLNLTNPNAKTRQSKAFKYIIKNLAFLGIIDDSLCLKIDKLYTVRNKVMHSEPLNEEELEILKNNFENKLINVQLVKNYCFYIINNYFKKYKYTIVNNFTLNKHEFDICAISNDINSSNIIFDIKYMNSFSFFNSNKIDTLMTKLKEYNLKTKKKHKLLILCFSIENEDKFNKFEIKFNKIITKSNIFKDDIYLLYIPISNINTLEASLDKTITKFLTKNEMNSFDFKFDNTLKNNTFL